MGNAGLAGGLRRVAPQQEARPVVSELPVRESHPLPGSPNFPQRVKERQDFGVPIFPYTLMFYGLAEPFWKQTEVLRAPGMDCTGGGRMWWVLKTA